MVRQAQTYLVGAVSGATLIAIAIAVFVLLVSVQVFKDWPVSGLGFGGESGSVSSAQPADSAAAGAAPAGASAASGGAAAGPGTTRPGSRAVTGNGTGATTAPQGGNGQAVPTGSGGGGNPAAPGGAGGPAAGGGGSGSEGAASGGGPLGGIPGTGGGSTPSGQVTGTVNETVHGVDETVTGGALESTGVTKVTEGVVNDVAGPQSPVGHVVDETVGAVGGLLPGHH